MSAQSSHPTATLLALTLAGALASPLAGCAASPAPRLIRSGDLSQLGPLEPGQPLIIEFAEGDTIPPPGLAK